MKPVPERDSRAPDLKEFEVLAGESFRAMPQEFRSLCGNLVIHVAEEAEPELLNALGIDEPLELSGLFEGVSMTEKSVADPYDLPNHVHLYRKSILAEWRERGDLSLHKLIAHVLVHEIGHHFGLSDADIDAIEQKEG